MVEQIEVREVTPVTPRWTRAYLLNLRANLDRTLEYGGPELLAKVEDALGPELVRAARSV
jgi:hypothetical protein